MTQHIRLFALLCVSLLMMQNASAADRRQDAEELVRDATQTLNYFTQAGEFAGLHDTADDAKAMVIIPASYRAGFLFGGSGGTGILIARNRDGSWSGPTFLSIGAFSFGLQAGGEVSEIVLLVMTERGMEGLLASSVKLGADISVAAGPVGVGAKAQTADVLAFSRSRGLYGGVSVEGSILDTKKKWNRAYYDADVSAVDVVFRGIQDNPASLPLREAAYQLANRGKASTAIRDPRAVPLADPTTVTPPAGRVYSAPGQLQGPTNVQQSNGQQLTNQPLGATPYQGAQYPRDRYPVAPGPAQGQQPVTRRVDADGFPILDGDDPVPYEDDEAFGAPLRLQPDRRP